MFSTKELSSLRSMAKNSVHPCHEDGSTHSRIRTKLIETVCLSVCLIDKFRIRPDFSWVDEEIEVPIENIEFHLQTCQKGLPGAGILQSVGTSWCIKRLWSDCNSCCMATLKLHQREELKQRSTKLSWLEKHLSLCNFCDSCHSMSCMVMTDMNENG